MTEAHLFALVLGGSVGLAGIALYRGVKIRRLKRQVREAEP